MVNKTYRKAFNDLETARKFGAEIDYIAKETMVPTGKRGKLKPIFGGPFIGEEEAGNYYYIEKDEGLRAKNIYYVGYHIIDPQRSLRADVLVAQRQAEAYLDAKYAELGPDLGISRT